MLKHINMKFYVNFLENQSLPKCTIVCAHVKFQWQNLLSVVAHHEISICSNVFVFARQKLESELDRNIETDVQKRRRKRTRREGVGEDRRLAALGELGWGRGENRKRTQRIEKAEEGW